MDVRHQVLSNGWSEMTDEEKKKMIGRFIGPSKKAVENNDKLKKIPSLRNSVIGPSWTNYKMWAKETKFAGEPLNGLKVEILNDDEGMYSQITCESEEMCKIAKHNLLKYESNFKIRKEKKIMNLFATFEHSKLGLLIGKGGSGVRALQDEACNQMDEEISESELSNCRKTFVRVSDFAPKDFEDFKTMVDSSNRHDFIGWGCNEGDEIIKINISSYIEEKTFMNFVECLSDEFSSRLSEIQERSKSFDDKNKSDFEEIMGVIEQDD